MKNLFYILFVLLLTIAWANQEAEKEELIFINNALNQAKTANKLLIIEFWAPECGPCIRLKRDIFENEKIKEFLDKNFILVKVSPADSIYKPLWKYFKLNYQSSVIFMDKNGNEIDRTVSYDGNRDAYFNFLKEVTEGKNLYSVVYSTYKKDTADVYSNYILAKKLLFRYQIKDAANKYSKVLFYDPDNKSGFNPECKFKIAECEFMLNGNPEGLQKYVRMNLKNDFVVKAYEYLINDLIIKKDRNGCISLCEEAINKFPESYEILNKYAWAICSFRIKEDYHKALTMAQKSISINPERAGTYSTAAWIYFGMGNKEKAIQLQNKAIDLYPNPLYTQDLMKFKSE